MLSCFQTGSRREILESLSYPGFALQPPVRLQSISHITCQSRGAAVSPSSVNYATAAFKMKARRLQEHKQGRATWAPGEGEKAGQESVPRWLTVSIIGRNRRQFRVTRTDTDCSRRSMTTKVAVGSRQVFEGKERNSRKEKKGELRHELKQDSKGNAGVRSPHAAVIEQHKFLSYITHRLHQRIQRKHTAPLSISSR